MKMIKAFANKLLPKESNRRLFTSWILRNYFYGFIAIVRSIYCTKKLTGSFLPIRCLVHPRMKLHLRVHKSANVDFNGILHVKPWHCATGSSFIQVNSNSTLNIKNDFEIGQNIVFYVSNNATLILGGKKYSSGSGITADTKVLVSEHIEIGEDSIIAWDCLITDSDWHAIEGVKKVSPVYIGKNVWLANGVSILKGSKVSDNSIIASKSIVKNVNNKPSVLLAGSPAKIIKENVSWIR